MAKHITIIQGHPDAGGNHFGNRLGAAYAEAAADAGHDVKVIDVAKLDFPLLRTKEDFEHGAAPAAIQEAQKAIAWADHLVIFFPLWLGEMPALLKGFLEQVFRPAFVTGQADLAPATKRLLKGKSARVVLTMGMPALFYRWYFGAYGLKNLKRNVLGFCGIRPIRSSLIGMVEAPGEGRHQKWIDRIGVLGARGI